MEKTFLDRAVATGIKNTVREMPIMATEVKIESDTPARKGTSHRVIVAQVNIEVQVDADAIASKTNAFDKVISVRDTYPNIDIYT